MNYTGHGVSTHWICKCHACGTIKSIDGHNLKYQGAISCGCQKSKGEFKIAQLLNENNIKFIQEFKFNDYKNRRFDFAILNDNNVSPIIIKNKNVPIALANPILPDWKAA